MRITESRLRKIIRRIILEDIAMKTALSPLEKSGDFVLDAFKSREISDNEMRSLNDIITMPLNDAREKRIANFGRNRYEEICYVLDLNPYKQYDYQISV